MVMFVYFLGWSFGQSQVLQEHIPECRQGDFSSWRKEGREQWPCALGDEFSKVGDRRLGDAQPDCLEFLN